MGDVVETAGRYRVRLEVQEDNASANPRTDQDCNLANVITLKGQRFINIDENGGPLAHGWDHFADRENGAHLFIRWARIFHGVVAVEENPYDGARAIWYVMPDKLAETTWTAERVIEAEVREYWLWANGEVYGHVIEKSVTRIPRDAEDRDDPGLDDETTEWEHVESCWGYVGREYAEEAAREAFAPYAGEVTA